MLVCLFVCLLYTYVCFVLLYIFVFSSGSRPFFNDWGWDFIWSPKLEPPPGIFGRGFLFWAGALFERALIPTDRGGDCQSAPRWGGLTGGDERNRTGNGRKDNEALAEMFFLLHSFQGESIHRQWFQPQGTLFLFLVFPLEL